MTESTPTTPTTEPVSTVTKHIKIYSDNPIHDCIDRLIDSCGYHDRFENDRYYFLGEILDIADELSDMCTRERLLISAQRLVDKSEQKPNP